MQLHVVCYTRCRLHNDSIWSLFRYALYQVVKSFHQQLKLIFIL